MFFAVLLFSAFFCLGCSLGAYDAIRGPEEGWVSLPADGGALELTGVPGEEIKLRLFYIDSSPDSSKSSVYLQLTDAESGFQTTLPARFEAGVEDDGGSRPIYALIPSPGVPGRQEANLSGTLWGQVVFQNGNASSVEAPVSLHVVQHGEAKTSGHRDNSGADRALLVLVLVYFLATGVMTALLYSAYVEEDVRKLDRLELQSTHIATETNGGLQ